MWSADAIQWLSDFAPAVALGLGVAGMILLTRGLDHAMIRIRELEARLPRSTASDELSPSPQPGPQAMAAADPEGMSAIELRRRGRRPAQIAESLGLGLEQVEFLLNVDEYVSARNQRENGEAKAAATDEASSRAISAKTLVSALDSKVKH